MLHRRGLIALLTLFAAAPRSLFAEEKMMTTERDDPLASYRWQNRVILIFADADDDTFKRQQAALAERKIDLHDRDLVVMTVFDDGVLVEDVADSGLNGHDLRRAYGIPAAAFAVLLIGKDGGVKRYANEPVAPDDLFALIDTMPMRQREMQKRQRQA